jgi:FkbM family methyltransferase
VNNKGEFLDRILDSLFNSKTNGVFIELGANDGLCQSNTAFLEFYRGWTGVMIEPSVNAYLKCVKNRPNSKCFNLACVSDSYENTFIEGDFNGGMMSSVEGKRTNNNSLVRCNVSTLEKILDATNITTVDFLSLDCEGYEYEILCGLNLTKYRPTYMLIEIYTKDFEKIVCFLNKHNYMLVGNITNYNPKENPTWDGTHNDYLFKDIVN